MPTIPSMEDFPPPIEAEGKQDTGVKKMSKDFKGWFDKTKKNIE